MQIVISWEQRQSPSHTKCTAVGKLAQCQQGIERPHSGKIAPFAPNEIININESVVARPGDHGDHVDTEVWQPNGRTMSTEVMPKSTAKRGSVRSCL